MALKKPTFEEAMHASIIWCKGWDNEEISDEVLAERVAELLRTNDGARGFFVTSLSSESPLMDRIPDPLIFQLRSAGGFVVELIVKNLAMSSAMCVYHKNNDNEFQRFQSNRIRNRCIELLRLLETSIVKTILENLLKGTQGEGSYEIFFKRWGYNEQQKEAIAKSIYEVAECQ